MPNYEYQCTGCGQKWEDIQTVARRDQPLADPCPHCGADRTVSRGWDSAPMGGADKSTKPSRDFTRRMETMRQKLGKYNPTVRDNIDRALDRRGGKYGTA
jgi:putative FmdB family regulatory protein